MSDIFLNWTVDDLINVGIAFGFFLGLVASTLCFISDEALEYFKNKRRERNKK